MTGPRGHIGVVTIEDSTNIPRASPASGLTGCDQWDTASANPLPAARSCRRKRLALVSSTAIGANLHVGVDRLQIVRRRTPRTEIVTSTVLIAASASKLGSISHGPAERSTAPRITSIMWVAGKARPIA